MHRMRYAREGVLKYNIMEGEPMKKHISKKERYEKLVAACEPFREAKRETIHTLAGIGRKHKLLRYPILVALLVFIFIYNVILYGCIQLKLREKFARGVALVMTVTLVFTGVNLTVFATTGKADDGANPKGVITAFRSLDETVAEQSLTVEAKENEINFPDTLIVTLETERDEELRADTASEGDAVPEAGAEPAADAVSHTAEDDKTEVLVNVKWQLDIAASTSEFFDSSKEGSRYVYVPVISDKYTLADSVSLPEITVTVKSSSDDVSLPDIDSYEVSEEALVKQEADTFTITYKTNADVEIGTITYTVGGNNSFPDTRAGYPKEFGSFVQRLPVKLAYCDGYYEDKEFTKPVVDFPDGKPGESYTIYAHIDNFMSVLSMYNNAENVSYAKKNGTINGDIDMGVSISNGRLQWMKTTFEKKASNGDWVEVSDPLYYTNDYGITSPGYIYFRSVSDSGTYRLKNVCYTAEDITDGTTLYYDYMDNVPKDEFTVNITPVELSITGVTAHKNCSDTTNKVQLSGGTLNGILYNDNVSFTLGDGILADGTAGSGKIVKTNIVLTGKDAGNYTLEQPEGIIVTYKHTGGTATCTEQATCEGCGAKYGSIQHEMTLQAKVEPTCTQNGKQAYYTCENCNRHFEDEKGEKEIPNLDGYGNIEAAGHSWSVPKWEWSGSGKDYTAKATFECQRNGCTQSETKQAEVISETTPASCTEAGETVYTASVVFEGKSLADSQRIQIAASHTISHVNAKAPTATEAGNIEYWHCIVCGRYFGNEDLTTEIRKEDTVLEATGTGPASGTVTQEVRQGANVPKTVISTPAAELEDMLLTETEKQQVQSGVNIRIVLEVNDAGSTVSTSDKNGIQQALNGLTVGQYLNIDLYKLVGENLTDITETPKKIRIVIAVPDSLKNTGDITRTFSVIRMHDGKAELLTDLDNNADTITIETDRFFTYAVVYKDVEPSDNPNNPPKPEEQNKPTKPSDLNSPQTGDTSNLALCFILLGVIGAYYLVTIIVSILSRKKKEEDMLP